MNLDRLWSDTSTAENTKLTRSPQKPSASNDPGKFPTKCILCEKQTTRKSHGKKEQCVTFAVFKDNRGVTLEPTWKQIKPRALAMGDNRLFHKVQGQDLFAIEAKYHFSCRKAFNLRYINHLRDTNSKKEGPPTEQEQKILAHQKMLDVVIDYIQESVIAQEEVVELRAVPLLYERFPKS